MLLGLSVIGINYKGYLLTKERFYKWRIRLLGLVPYTSGLYIILKLKLERNLF